MESSFADQRTYFYQGRDVDQQVHLGFDLASTGARAGAGLERAARIVFADFLGIYGNCVILDHGMGLQSLYAHLSSIGVKVGRHGRRRARSWAAAARPAWPAAITCTSRCCSAATPITPVDWWSEQWIQDRVLRKLREAEHRPGAGGAHGCNGGGCPPRPAPR